MFKEDPAKFLDMMIMKALLLQEIRKQGSQPGKEDKGEEAAIQEFLQKKFSSPPTVSTEELAAFYESYKDRMEGKTLEQVAPMIEQVIRQQKQEEEYMRFLEGLREQGRRRDQPGAVEGDGNQTGRLHQHGGGFFQRP